MSLKGDCYDNAPMESFFHTLKTKLVHRRHCATRAEATRDIFVYLDGLYKPASQHPSVYVVEEKRFCCSGCDPMGYFWILARVL
ncbi:IS3 family transposase [Bradyrhizobium sp. Pha-3]|uniref:IS3 family transposase n=1 Tax=Bradyrhizobium sp. Pha-3 TaxID=208375 RepID=UPI0035D42710